MNMFNKKLFNKHKGFTLIELIVVIAVIGILVLLAAPKFLGYVEKAQITRILHDTKIVDNKVEETLAMNKEAFGGEELTNEQLLELIAEGKLFDLKGKVLESNKDLIITDTYKKISSEIIKASKTGLKGNFYLGSGGKMYYEHTKSIGDNTDPINPVDPVDPVDKTALINEIQEAKDLSESNYVEGWENLLQAIQQAEIINNKSTATDIEIADAIENINAAIGQLIKKSVAPGPDTLTSGDDTYGFYGEVLAKDFITGANLSTELGITQGTLQHSDTSWLKFNSNGETIYVAKKPIRHTISWDQINAKEAVFGKEIKIGEQTYKVRLMRGSSKKPSSNGGPDLHGSEWNRLMLPIHQQAKNKSWDYPANIEANADNWTAGINGGNGYTDADLLTHYTHGNGSYSWMQETYTSNTSYRLFRGSYGVSGSTAITSSVSTSSYYGWRPVLELVD